MSARNVGCGRKKVTGCEEGRPVLCCLFYAHLQEWSCAVMRLSTLFPRCRSSASVMSAALFPLQSGTETTVTKRRANVMDSLQLHSVTTESWTSDVGEPESDKCTKRERGTTARNERLRRRCQPVGENIHTYATKTKPGKNAPKCPREPPL